MPSGLVFNLQRFSIHDGPGIRTTVFLKGCPLRCFWCHNPEGLHPRLEVQFTPSRCIGCGACVLACQHGAQELGPHGRLYHRDRCATCGACVLECFAEALQLTGREMTVEQVMAEVLRDRAFYESSGGGVTLSGGEPLLQPAFTLALLQASRAAGLHTAIETTTQTRWENLHAVLPFVDLFMVDIKHLDSARHQAATGIPNHRLLANIRRLSATGKPILFRIPVVPTVNASVPEIQAIAEFVHALSAARPAGAPPLALELLPFHRLAADKYTSLGLDDRAATLTPLDRAAMTELIQAARAVGVPVTGASDLVGAKHSPPPLPVGPA